MLKTVLVPIHHDGYKFILAFGIATLVLAFIAAPLGWIGSILTLWCVYFFRDPVRVTPIQDNIMVAPADGMIVNIQKVPVPKELCLNDQTYTKISIFLNVFDVHVNKAPLDGKIKKISYIQGKFINASLDKASLDNERMAMSVETHDHDLIGVVQIAGLIARRIKYYVQEEDTLERGKNYGNIRFGSRVDLYVPDNWEIKVLMGQKMIGGETVMAEKKASFTPTPSQKNPFAADENGDIETISPIEEEEDNIIMMKEEDR